MVKVLVIGASRGIGLELARQCAHEGDAVIATVRSRATGARLEAALAGRPTSRIVELDLADSASIHAAASLIDEPLDEVVVVAGAVGGPRQSVDDFDVDEWRRTLDVNTIGPLVAAAAFKRNLIASGNGKLMFVTSQLAASTWPMGGRYIYASTKAALNKVAQSLAIDWAREPISVLLMHPGWVQTDMGGPNATLPVEESARGVRTVLRSAGKGDSGKFFKWNGDIHPW